MGPVRRIPWATHSRLVGFELCSAVHFKDDGVLPTSEGCRAAWGRNVYEIDLTHPNIVQALREVVHFNLRGKSRDLPENAGSILAYFLQTSDEASSQLLPLVAKTAEGGSSYYCTFALFAGCHVLL
eukprot:4368427-Amphidinium_carterae.1